MRSNPAGLSASSLDGPRIDAAFHTARQTLLAARNQDGVFEGRLSSSPLSTATAISALALAEQHVDDDQHADGKTDTAWFTGVMMRNELSELFTQSLGYLAKQQNDDGGWGDTDLSPSNIATTMLVEAAFHLTGVPAKYTGMLERAQEYVKVQGGVVGLRDRYGRDKTFAAPILANCALAGLVPWSKVSALPFELAALPQRWYHKLGLPVVSYAIPALVAIGQARHHHHPTWNPLTKFLRDRSKQRTLDVLEEIQPASGGFLEATPLTSFVVMSLASIGQADSSVVRNGVEFLLASVRADGSWPIDTNLATWNTSQAVSALDWEFDADFTGTGRHKEGHDAAPTEEELQTLDWLLDCQLKRQHPYTGAQAGGWAWTDLSGGVPDADDTSAALLALSTWRELYPNVRCEAIQKAALAGIDWLLDLQNADGGMPTFCRGWGKLPFDRSSTDITAHAIRSWRQWQQQLHLKRNDPPRSARIEAAVSSATQFLIKEQKPDGRWNPLWFGNAMQPDESNPVYGTSKVLLALEPARHDACGFAVDNDVLVKAVNWLAGVQHACGGWGVADVAKKRITKLHPKEDGHAVCSVEETALAVEALLPWAGQDAKIAQSVQQGVEWLCDRVESGRHTEPAAIGFYFAKLWYYEELYPQIFATQTLRHASQLAMQSTTAALAATV
ncbi:prenyltransferase/squalene oxidase repeat-containing protein [Adhaeretor mobilis]|uniref:Squalene--hopene cyclase n=1 Tax=Adhaeretor mobilis TaxID=1930276 RepID=A0A517N2B6_9BACT|nr:prenyltransferase/squalene oxidase repeat-containing protein [Adhaeretor mobilis]QDT01148.1 Squalene--hopene cyclase [Adhaeretor mobilis]